MTKQEAANILGDSYVHGKENLEKVVDEPKVNQTSPKLGDKVKINVMTSTVDGYKLVNNQCLRGLIVAEINTLGEGEGKHPNFIVKLDPIVINYYEGCPDVVVCVNNENNKIEVNLSSDVVVSVSNTDIDKKETDPTIGRQSLYKNYTALYDCEFYDDECD